MDSLGRQQGQEFCTREARSRHIVFPRRGVEDIAEKVDDFVAAASEVTAFVYLVGTNSVMKARSGEMVDKFRKFVGKLRGSRRHSAVCGFMLRHNVISLIFRKMLINNDCVWDMCRMDFT